MRDLNKLVMNYLVIEGFKDAAQKFAEEARVDPQVNLETIQDRMTIRNAVQNGNIESAIEVPCTNLASERSGSGNTGYPPKIVLSSPAAEID
jgi:hypothetical protein